MRYTWILLFVAPLMIASTKPEPTAALNKLVDDWHVAAAQVNFDGYFGATSDGFIFLGTAPEERWTKADFMSYCKPYFDAGSAWNFKPSNRKWRFSQNGKTAWFDEDLDTWMRGCRGTGVLEKIKGEWKIVYYNLHVLIENEKVQSFIQLRDAPLPEPDLKEEGE